jgi:hypothetical protein
MKVTTLLTGLALSTLACGQGGQSQQPPPSGASNRPATAAGSARASEPSARTAVQPEGSGASASEKPAPTYPPDRVRLSVPNGTVLPIEIQTEVSTAHSHEGDPVLAVLTEDVPLKGFKLDKGAEVRGQVMVAVSAKRVKGRAHLVVGFDSVMKGADKLAVETETIDSMAKSTKSKDTKIIAGAAAAGLIVGAIKDGGKGAAVGTLVGAAAGTGAVLIMKGDEVEIPRGARLSVTVIK